MASWDNDPVVGQRPKWESDPIAAPDPTEGMGTMERLRAGVGMGLAKVARAVGQPFGFVSQDEIDEASRLDAALAHTTAGRVGGFIGQAAPVAATALIPGANTYLGASLIGAGTGALTTEGGMQERTFGALLGLGGGAAAKGFGDLLGLGAKAFAARGAERVAAQNARAAIARQAIDAGYTLPPTEIRPTMLSSILEGLSGKIKTSQAASARNQEVTTGLAKKALGIAPDEQITVDALKTIRAAAGQAYDDLGRVGQYASDPTFKGQIAALRQPIETFAKQFPEVANQQPLKFLDAVSKDTFDGPALVEALKRFRFDGAANKASLDPAAKELGRVQLKAAEALESLVERNLQRSGAPELLNQFRDARQLIAKTYTVEKALNQTTGQVSAKTLGTQLAKGKPLSGELKTAAEVAQAYPKATQTLPQNYNALSPLDFGVAMATGDVRGLVARPAVRSLILSGPAQRFASRQTAPTLYELLDATANNPTLRAALPGLAGIALPAFKE